MEKRTSLQDAIQLIEAAKKVEDPLENLKPFKLYERNGLRLALECRRTIDADDLKWAFNLTKANMKMLYKDVLCSEQYEQSEWHWKEKEKWKEMADGSARYLIARSLDDGKPVAFVHFRYDMDNDVEVLYCYEIQIEKAAQGKGLGKMLMQILELLAFQSQMKKVVLTVFKHGAVKFFMEKMKYNIDTSSPSVRGFQDCTYEILNKWVKKRAI